jgi:hypothetical protein
MAELTFRHFHAPSSFALKKMPPMLVIRFLQKFAASPG